MVLVSGLDEQDPVCLVEEQDASGDVGTAAIGGSSATARTLRACAQATCSRVATQVGGLPRRSDSVHSNEDNHLADGEVISRGWRVIHTGDNCDYVGALP